MRSKGHHRFIVFLLLSCFGFGCASVKTRTEKVSEREVSTLPIGEPTMVAQQERSSASGFIAGTVPGGVAGVDASEQVSRSYEQCMQRHDVTIEDRFQSTPYKTGIAGDMIWGTLFVVAGISGFVQSTEPEDRSATLAGASVTLLIGGIFFFNGIRVAQHSVEPSFTTSQRTQQRWLESNSCKNINTSNASSKTEAANIESKPDKSASPENAVAPPDASPKTTFSLSEAAAICGVEEAVVEEWIKAGSLSAVKVGEDFRISRRALQDAWSDMGGGELFP